jgi:prepilin-type N-terminal cleavage/methylation domain-containing protein
MPSFDHTILSQRAHFGDQRGRRVAAAANRGIKRGFTLTEILIVIGLIVLFITLALPAFNLLSGGRSVAGATNEVAAFVGRARAEAIGVQQVRGVGFYFDAATQKSVMCIVHQPFQETPSSVASSAGVTTPDGTYVMPSSNTYDVWNFDSVANVGTLEATDQYVIDAETSADILPLPSGVGAQLLNNCTIVTTTTPYSRTSNGYVSFGAILFDGTGNLVSKPISISKYGIIGKAANLASVSSQNLTSMPAIGAGTYTSQFGAVLFDLPTFTNIGGTMAPPYSLTQVGAYSATQETWLDTNATPLLINRYNGTLIKSE